MLNPNERKLYLEALKPPADYTLDRGIATTYSLDLLTLLIVPLSLVLFDYGGDDDLKDQTKMLEALQRTSDRLTIYCQRGLIAVPKIKSLLYSYLEKTVVEIDAPGTFHPKTWLLRFTSERKHAKYRFICLSRNLTFDKSWDTLLVLDGELTESTQTENQALIDYMGSLPLLAGVASQDLGEITDELSRVKFEAPPGFSNKIIFWPVGIDGYRRNPLLGKADRMLIISPFVSDKLLQDVVKKSEANCILLSRLDSLDALQLETIDLFERILILDEPDLEENDEGDETVQENDRSNLHAKLYVIEQGNTTRVLTGSANATNAAFSINTEFMVEMRANKNVFSVDSFLSSEKNLFGSVVRDYKRNDSVSVDEVKAKLEAMVKEVRQQITSSNFSLEVLPGEDKGTFNLGLFYERDSFELIAGASVICWPITLQDNMAKDISYLGKGGLFFNNLSAVALTSFMAFDISVCADDNKSSARFVLNLPLVGMPEDRYENILIQIISDRNRFLRYLILLLSEGKIIQPGLIEFVAKGDSGDGSALNKLISELPLLEELIRALSRNPKKIDRIDRLVRELQKTEEGREILPEEFGLIWGPIWEARLRMVDKR
jgi:hypothetical protein